LNELICVFGEYYLLHFRLTLADFILWKCSDIHPFAVLEIKSDNFRIENAAKAFIARAVSSLLHVLTAFPSPLARFQCRAG